MPGCVKPANADLFPVVASLGGGWLRSQAKLRAKDALQC